EMVDGLLKAPLEQMLVAFEGDPTWCHVRRQVRSTRKLGGQVESVNGIKKKQGAHALIEVLAAPPECVQLRTLTQQLVPRQSSAHNVQRLVANDRVGGDDDAREARHVAFSVFKVTKRDGTVNCDEPDRGPSRSAAHRVDDPHLPCRGPRPGGALRTRTSA